MLQNLHRDQSVHIIPPRPYPQLEGVSSCRSTSQTRIRTKIRSTTPGLRLPQMPSLRQRKNWPDKPERQSWRRHSPEQDVCWEYGTRFVRLPSTPDRIELLVVSFDRNADPKSMYHHISSSCGKSWKLARAMALPLPVIL